jgi:hypothetical protein
VKVLAIFQANPMKMEQTEYSETLSFKLQTSGYNPEENIRRSKHGKNLISRTINKFSLMLQITFLLK